MSPSDKLSVNGAIRCKRLVVLQTEWADYVFDSCYKRPSLAYLEQYIKDHKHLPDIPSAKEAVDKGVDVGDCQAILLKKVEELTLYMIEQNKKMEQVIHDNEELKKQISILVRK